MEEGCYEDVMILQFVVCLHFAVLFVFSQQQHSILDLMFYDANTVSLLLLRQNPSAETDSGSSDPGVPILAQAPLAPLEKDAFIPILPGDAPLIDTPQL